MAQENSPSGTSHESTSSSPPEKTTNNTDIRKLIQEELDRNNKYLEFVQGQIVQDRQFFKHLYTYTAAFIAIIIFVSAYFQYTSVTQMRSDMKASVDAEINRSKAEIDALRAQAAAASAEAQATIAKEIAIVRTEVQNRIDKEFKSENITATVSAAAKARTEKELTGIIRSETSAQVAKGIQDEQPLIRKIVEDKTKDAVKALEPTIGSSVEKATQDQVTKSVAPVVSQMNAYGKMIHMGTLATLARGDDRHAFDYLVQVALGKAPESADTDLRKVADSTSFAIIGEKESVLQFGLQFKEKQSPDAMKQFMTSKNARDRQAALDNYPQDDKSILPYLVEMIRSDDSITNLYKAVKRFNVLTKQSFEFWKHWEILDWWEKNKNSFK